MKNRNTYRPVRAAPPLLAIAAPPNTLPPGHLATPHRTQRRALCLGAAGFAVGASLGRTLVDGQAARLGSAIEAAGGVPGSPYADLIWCQACGALLAGMATELANLAVMVSWA
jgi:hypothetical protein